MLTDAVVRESAARLDEAETARRQIRMLSLDHPHMTVEDAYAIQKAWIARKVAAGRAVRGHKVGLTSKAMQYAVGINEPDFGILLDDMFFANGDEIPVQRFIELRVEAELAFILQQPLAGPNCTAFDVVNATEFVTPAIEILDTRIFRVDPETKATRKVLDTIADNAANAGVVLGDRRFKPADHDLRWISAICSRNGEIEETGVAAAVMNHPANAISWLANRLSRYGEVLQPAEVLLSGSFIRPIEVRSGDAIEFDYGPLGTVSCRFA
jgi:2-oxo-hept-3-ene-1,7-dioate hydratase